MTPADFALVIRQVESGNDPRAYGDGGLALTSYQVHPSWVWTLIRDYGVAEEKPGQSTSWDAWIGNMVQQFFEHQSAALSDLEIAMYFHLGHKSQLGDPDWDEAYANRFAMFANRIG